MKKIHWELGRAKDLLYNFLSQSFTYIKISAST